MNKREVDKVDTFPIEQTFIWKIGFWGRIRLITDDFAGGKLKYIELFVHEPLKEKPTHKYEDMYDFMTRNKFKFQVQVNSLDFSVFQQKK